MNNIEYTNPLFKEITEQECETISGGYRLFPYGFWDKLPPSERTIRFDNYRNLAPKISIGFNLGPIQFSWF
ncbi:MAG: hypothetical protein HEQ25_08050 [Dolichospermum sp. DET73]|jgi:hypothetical protein|nr:hypothetical protein [Dolichospermum sp. DET73]